MPYKPHIDWAWNSGDACGKPVCFFYVISKAPPIIRDSASAHLCVVFACRLYQTNEIDLAAKWLMAAQAHNPEAQRVIWEHRVAATRYAYERYGGSFTNQDNKEAENYSVYQNQNPQELWNVAQQMFNTAKTNATWDDIMENGIESEDGQTHQRSMQSHKI